MNIPVELAQARAQTIEAWNEFQRVINRDHTVAEFDEALRIANGCEYAANQLYDRWQAVGGTSDTVSIVESENAVRIELGPQEPPADYRIFNRRLPDGTFPPLSEFFDEAVRLADAATEPATVGEMVSVTDGTHPLDDLGTHVIASGGEVIEFGSKQWYDSIDPIEF